MAYELCSNDSNSQKNNNQKGKNCVIKLYMTLINHAIITMQSHNSKGIVNTLNKIQSMHFGNTEH